MSARMRAQLLRPGDRVRSKVRAGELGTVERRARGNTLGDWWIRWDSRPWPVPAYERELEHEERVDMRVVEQ